MDLGGEKIGPLRRGWGNQRNIGAPAQNSTPPPSLLLKTDHFLTLVFSFSFHIFCFPWAELFINVNMSVKLLILQEVNEVVQKVSGTDQPVPLWTEEGFSVGKEPSKPLLYSLHFTLKVWTLHLAQTSTLLTCYNIDADIPRY